MRRGTQTVYSGTTTSAHHNIGTIDIDIASGSGTQWFWDGTRQG